MSTEEKIKQYISNNRDHYIDLLREWVQHPTRSGQEYALQKKIADRLENSGLHVDFWEPDRRELEDHPAFTSPRKDFKDSPNVVGTLKGSGGGHSLILNGHIDVVPEGDLEQWEDDPFSGAVKDGKMFGRGTTDMKGGNLALLIALEAIVEMDITLKGDLIFQSVIEEESGGAGTLAAIKRGYKADAALIPEPTQMKIIPKQQGSMWFRVTVRGISAHAGTRFEGISALEKSWKVYDTLMALENQRNIRLQDPLFKNMTIPIPINVGTIQGGSWPSSVPSKVVMEGRYGIGPDETMEEAKAELEQSLHRLQQYDDFFKQHPVDVEWFGANWIPGSVDLSHPLLGILQNQYESSQHEEPVIQASNWGTDGGMLTQYADTPAIVFGPGTTKMAHFPNECIELDNIFEIAEIFFHTIIEWCEKEN
ncbi:peptidase [Bacillus sp. FJAT-44742]|uniref:peptidase n=1 Tax=Bacillus sp. FJAT-44742 TaxID=2014005 RepID=UPI000C2382F5|nr:peptidase [Bacillus sp. FJAT-44742]